VVLAEPLLQVPDINKNTKQNSETGFSDQLLAEPTQWKTVDT
jgi:hypothetical protein